MSRLTRERSLMVAALMGAAAALAADPPHTELSNGMVRAKLYLPDPEQGYYRGTRFDWAGQVAVVEYKGHKFFGQWFEKYDPKQHDAIMGPVEEFLTNDAGLGYAEAKPGENFVKIGVGTLRKPDEPRFRQYSTYDITDSGKRTVRQGRDWIEFTQQLPDTLGYAYLYRKTLRLTQTKPELVLEHRLKNTGRKTIESTVYEHNFYMIDGLPTGPGLVVKFPFDVRATASLNGLAEIHGRELVYLKELQPRQTVQSILEGYGDTAKDYDFRIENRQAGAGIRQTGDRPIERINYWSIRTTANPEAYIHIKIEPGKEFTWRIAYEFYTLNP